MNNIAPILQNAGLTKSPSNCLKNARTTKWFLELAFYTSEGRTCKVLSFYDFWFTFDDKFCSPYKIVDFLRIFNHQNRKP